MQFEAERLLNTEVMTCCTIPLVSAYVVNDTSGKAISDEAGWYRVLSLMLNPRSGFAQGLE